MNRLGQVIENRIDSNNILIRFRPFFSERNRINDRFHNEKFRKFMNITQILVFSNNQEYNNDSIVPIEGAFYGTPSDKSVFFNCFREEEPSIFDKIGDISDTEENYILKDNERKIK